MILCALSCSFGFVNFKNLSDAVRAKREMEGKPLATSIKLSIQFTKVRSAQGLLLPLFCQPYPHASARSPTRRWMRAVGATTVDQNVALNESLFRGSSRVPPLRLQISKNSCSSMRMTLHLRPRHKNALLRRLHRIRSTRKDRNRIMH